MARQRMTFENRIEQARQKIHEEPLKALQEIGKLLVKEIKSKVAKSTETRSYYKEGRAIVVKPGRLKKSIGYWFRRREGDLQIGSKAFYALWIEKGSSKNRPQPFLLSTIEANLDMIQSLIREALQRLR